MPQLRECAHTILQPAWATLEQWLVLMHGETTLGVVSTPCYSAACRTRATATVDAPRLDPTSSATAAYQCYAPGCRKGVGTGGVSLVAVGLAGKATNRVVGMMHAYYTLYRIDDGTLAPMVHSFFVRHRRIIAWIIKNDVSVLFKKLNFILGHHGLLHLFSDAVRSEPFEVRQAWFYKFLDDDRNEQHATHSGRLQEDWQIPVLVVSRKNLFESSCELFLSGPPMHDTTHRGGHVTRHPVADGSPAVDVSPHHAVLGGGPGGPPRGPGGGHGGGGAFGALTQRFRSSSFTGAGAGGSQQITAPLDGHAGVGLSGGNDTGGPLGGSPGRYNAGVAIATENNITLGF